MNIRLFFAILVASIGVSPAGAAEIRGPATVIDGQTLQIDGQLIRLHGVTAPGIARHCPWRGKSISCGLVAKTALMDLTAGNELRCRVRPSAVKGGPIVAVCFAKGFDIGRNLVHTGWVRADRAHSLDYAATENKARRAGRGLWGGAKE